MASVHAFLRKKPNRLNLFPIGIRVTVNRRSTYFLIGQHVALKHWDEKRQMVKKSHPNSVRLNNLVAARVSDTNRVVLEAIDQFGQNVTVSQIRSLLTRKQSRNSFFAFTEVYFEQLQVAKKYTRINSERPLVKKIRALVGSRDLTFDHITVPFLRDIIASLKRDEAISERSIANVLMFIRNMYNRAIDENLAKRESYPFGSGKGKVKISIPQTIKIGLTRAEVARIEELDLPPTSPQFHARAAWLFSFYTAGMRVADVLKVRWTDIHDGRLYYRMGKNQKTLSLPISQQLQGILDQYAPGNDLGRTYVFPELDGEHQLDSEQVLRKVRTANHKFNKHLKTIARMRGINKKISMHVARHTFANIAGDSIHPVMLQKLYRHSNLKTTLGYMSNFIHKDADEALEKVLNPSS